MPSFFTREYFFLGKLLPQGLIRSVEAHLVFAGIDENPLSWAGRRAALLLLFTFLAMLIPLVNAIYTFENPLETEQRIFSLIYGSLGWGLVSFAAIFTVFYTHIYFIIDDRTRRVEKALPDFLILVVANLRAGLTPLNAFIAACRPEFGPLSEEVKESAKKLTGGESISVMFLDLGSKFNSELFRNVVGFFDRAARSGGRLADILESSSEYVRRVEELREEVILLTRAHTIFLLFMVVVIMPFLLSVSAQFTKLVSDIPVITGDSSVAIPLFSGSVRIGQDFILNASRFMLVLVSVMVSLLFGIITRGQAFYGVKYSPLIILLSLMMFEVSRVLIGGLVSQFV